MDITVQIISDFLSPTGYGKAARDFIFCLDKAGIRAKPVFPPSSWSGADLNPSEFSKLKELAQQEDIGDVVQIEMLVPELMTDNRNYGYCVWETTRLPKGWAEKLNKKVAVLTCSDFSKQAMVNSGVRVPVYVIPHVVEPSVSKVKLNIPELKGQTTVLLSGEFTPRKNIQSSLFAWYIAANGDYKHTLLLKTCGLNPGVSGMKVKQMVEEAKQNAKQYIENKGEEFKEAKVYLIDKILEDRFIEHLYKNSDYFFTASCGEAFNLPLAEACCHGLIPVCPAEGGHRQYLPDGSAVFMMGNWAKSKAFEGNPRYGDAGNWYEITPFTMVEAFKMLLNGDFEELKGNAQEAVKVLLSNKNIGNIWVETLKTIHNPVIQLHTPKNPPKYNPKRREPFIIKCVQALNEEKLIKAQLKNRYDDVDLILVVEGAARGRPDQKDGHSIDKTHKLIKEFCEEQKEDKIVYLTKEYGFTDYEDIKNVFSTFINSNLRGIQNKVCYISDVDEFMTKEDFDKVVETFIGNPECSEVVPKFLHYYDSLDIIQRPVPTKMNILHQRFTRWQNEGMYFFNHPTLTSLRDRVDTACHPSYQDKRIIVDAYIHHIGDIKSPEFYKMKHDYYNRELSGHLNLDYDWKCKREFPKDRLMYFDGTIPGELLELYDVSYGNDYRLPVWTQSAAYNGELELIPLFTGMVDTPFLFKGDYKEAALGPTSEEVLESAVM